MSKKTHLKSLNEAFGDIGITKENIKSNQAGTAFYAKYKNKDYRFALHKRSHGLGLRGEHFINGDMEDFDEEILSHTFVGLAKKIRALKS